MFTRAPIVVRAALAGSRASPAIASPIPCRKLHSNIPLQSPNTDTSTAARPRRRLKKVPITLDVPAPPTAEEAVANMLYNAPPSSRAPVTRHILNCLVSNEPGVLSRVSGVLAARGFNIDSLIVARTEVPDLSRMTLVVNGQDTVIEQARRQLEDLVPVWAVLDYTHSRVVERELLLLKVSTVPDSHVEERAEEFEHHVDAVNPLMQSGLQRQAISELARLFSARIVDVALESMVIELTAKPDRIDAFLQLMKPYGISEAARSGSMAMPRAPLAFDGSSETPASSDADVDLTSLPPG
ncbi:acetolactate synthase [Synchytrium microbalum]|uniref:Acetolactate synthase n=1 Tax=Synchytrium microbalum TaxID=1806994 RepID=A0A507CKC0_9FUNG|nr:acetolactate synthase [Synchytrium microbalum]TPX38273.1 acetolactate synthase [Synchytrium microbalum]